MIEVYFGFYYEENLEVYLEPNGTSTVEPFLELPVLGVI